MSVSLPNSEVLIASGELRVVILGPLRLLLQAGEFQMPFPGNGSQAAFWNALLERFPALRDNRGAVRLARNSRFLMPEEILMPGDEVALIPPVSGG